MSGVEAFEFAGTCIREYEKIQTYADKGDIERQHPPEELREAYRELKRMWVRHTFSHRRRGRQNQIKEERAISSKVLSGCKRAR